MSEAEIKHPSHDEPPPTKDKKPPVKITKEVVDAMGMDEILYDSEIKGFVARRLKTGATFGLRYRNRAGDSRWLKLGRHGNITATEARNLAKKHAGEVAAGRDPVAERQEARARTENTVDNVLDDFLEQYVKPNLRSAKEVERVFDVYVRPRIGKRAIYDVSRSDISKMLDKIAEENGPVMADRTLAHVRKAFYWWATRDDRFSPPFVRGMARTKPAERARDRVLSDEEIRDVWKALDSVTEPKPYASYVRTLLLTAQRRGEVAGMRWENIADRMWTIPKEGYKTKIAHSVPLTDSVVKLIGSGAKGYVFSTTKGKKAFSGFSKAKATLDEKIGELRKREGRRPMAPWTLHDLRRTARTLMSRAGADRDIGERVLGHVIPGVSGVYDRHTYDDEKLAALKALANLIDRILNPTDNVRAFATTA